LGLEWQKVFDAANRLGISVYNQLSPLDQEQRVAIITALQRWPPEESTGTVSKLKPCGPKPLNQQSTRERDSDSDKAH
jgi:hypothetical protein